MDELSCADAINEPLQAVGANFYFDPETVAYGKEHLNLDGFRFYILGRGGVLGDVSATLVRSAFGYFNEPLMDKMWNSAKERCAPDVAAREYMGCGHRTGERKFDHIDVAAFNEAAYAVIDSVDHAGLPLFAGYTDLERPDSAAANAMHASAILRELRGAVHLAAIAAAGLSSKVAHSVKRPSDFELFGYSEPIETPEGAVTVHAEIEITTAETMARHLNVLDATARTALAKTAQALQESL